MKMTNFIKGIAKKLGKWWLGAISLIIISLLGTLAWWVISTYILSEQPIEPNITSSPGSNPIVNTDSTKTIIITANPAFNPPYVNDIEVTVQNENSRTCYMVIEFRTSEGFKFLPISDSLPENFIVEEGYEYQDIMTVYIKDFPPEFDYRPVFSVYTMDPDTFGGTEQIIWEVLEIQYEG